MDKSVWITTETTWSYDRRLLCYCLVHDFQRHSDKRWVKLLFFSRFAFLNMFRLFCVVCFFRHWLCLHCQHVLFNCLAVKSDSFEPDNAKSYIQRKIQLAIKVQLPARQREPVFYILHSNNSALLNKLSRRVCFSRLGMMCSRFIKLTKALFAKPLHGSI